MSEKNIHTFLKRLYYLQTNTIVTRRNFTRDFAILQAIL